MNPGELEGSPRRPDQVMLAAGDAVALDPDHADGARAVAEAVGGSEIEGDEGAHAGRRARSYALLPQNTRYISSRSRSRARRRCR